MEVDLVGIDDRIQELDRRMYASAVEKKKSSLLRSFTDFLTILPDKPTGLTCMPEHVKKFLVWKDSCGKTVVHDFRCKFLGSVGTSCCSCPIRLASGTVAVILQNLVDIFENLGRGRLWDVGLRIGNPALSPVVKFYLKQVREEQARSRILPKQAKPIFLAKLRSICRYIGNELNRKDLSLKERYVLLRDRAWFTLQFFAGDRAGDLALVLSQEVKVLHDESGLVFNHTFGKTIRGFGGKSNKFVVKACMDKAVCPVLSLNRYIKETRGMEVDLSCGYLFRIVSESGGVLDQPVSYSVIYERLRLYLVALGIYDGETPHSFRAGCAVTLALSGAVDDVGQMMRHIGWFGEEAPKYYSRLPTLTESVYVASKLASSVSVSHDIELEYKKNAEFDFLPSIFQ